MQVLALPAFRFIDNPYTSQLYKNIELLGVKVNEFTPARLLNGPEEIWHLHWPDYYLNDHSPVRAISRSIALLALMKLAHLRRKRIVWTVHNLATHERLYPRIEHWFWPAFISGIDGYITLSRSGMNAAKERFPRMHYKPGFVIPHGHYRNLYPDDMTQEAAKMSFGINQDVPIILFFGSIRPYKNVLQLIKGFRKMGHDKAMLVIAGKCGCQNDETDVRKAQSDDSRIKLFLEFIPVAEVQRFMRIADLVVLPFREILNSGSAILALSFGRPVLIPDKGAMSELQSLVGSEWVMTYKADLTSSVLRDSLAWATHIPVIGAPSLQSLDGEQIALQTIEAYKQICKIC